MIGNNSTNLNQTKGGEVIKQGDFSSLFEFELLDYDNQKITSLDGQTAKVRLGNSKGKIEIETLVEKSKVSFKIGKVLPVGIYQIEIEAGNYVFPSDKSAKVDVIQSIEEYTSKQVEGLEKESEKDNFPELVDLYNLANLKRQGEIMSLNTERITRFAQAVGLDIKEIKRDLANKAEKSEVGQGGITQQQLDTAIQGVKTAILGEGVPEELDTLKEIVDKIKAGETPDSAIIAKLTELGGKITDFENLDLVATYTTAKE